tara:strand:+ start:880 stop:1158 length:279 start_codon:yes stop_codon:yes gene_type:complete
MRYLLFIYLTSIAVGLGLGFYFNTLMGVISALLGTYFLSMKLTGLVYKKIKAVCPLCNAEELTEKITLQCKPTKYQCEECNSIFSEGVLIKK